MQICMLVQAEMYPIPESLKAEFFGNEKIVDRTAKVLARGQVAFVTGEPKDIAEWLKPFEGVWQTSSPMLGDWEVFHVKDLES